MLDRTHAGLSIRRQCRLLGLARSNIYRPAPGAGTDELLIMRRLDELFLAWPFFGSRRMTAMLRSEGHRINRKRVRRLMRLMGSQPSARGRRRPSRRRGTRSIRTSCAAL